MTGYPLQPDRKGEVETDSSSRCTEEYQKERNKDGGGKSVARTERESERRRREEQWQPCWCYRDQPRASTMAQASAEKLEHTRPFE